MLFLSSLWHKTLVCFFLYVLTGNLDWVGNEFNFNAGAGLVISQPEGIEERNSTVVEQLRAAFERDWFSRYSRSMQANKIPCNRHRINRLVSVKTSHLDNGPVPIRAGQHDREPAPLRNSHKDDGQTRTRHHDDRLSKITRQSMTNGMVPIIDSHQERGRVKISHPDNRQVQIRENYRDNPMDPPSQSAESSGSTEIANGSLWPQSMINSFRINSPGLCSIFLSFLRKQKDLSISGLQDFLLCTEELRKESKDFTAVWHFWWIFKYFGFQRNTD